jgi:hypothetical protein
MSPPAPTEAKFHPNDPKGAAGAKKAPMWLLPPYALQQTAWVHKLGADKYGTRIPVYACNNGIELVEFCSCGHFTQSQYATQIDHTQHAGCALSATVKNIQKAEGHCVTKEELTGQKECANPAMTGTSDYQIQITINGKKVSLTTGSQKIRNILLANILNIIKDQKSKKEIISIIELELSAHLDCLLRTNPEFYPIRITDVKFAEDQQEEKECLTSTTIIKQVNSEDSFATDATRVLACSEMISNLLKKHSSTCEVHNLKVFDGAVERYGAYNWRDTGVCATTYISAIMRHLDAWRDGEDIDPESGVTHLAHIAASCNILMDAHKCGKLIDDRSKRP